MTTATVCIPIYEPTFNPILNKFVDKTTQELKMCYSFQGCFCPCKEYKIKNGKFIKKTTYESEKIDDMYKFKNSHMSGKYHQMWLDLYNKENDTKDICEKTNNELKVAYVELQKNNRKKIADMKNHYDDAFIKKADEIQLRHQKNIEKIEEKYKKEIKELNDKHENIIDIYEEKLTNKDDTITLLTKQIKELQNKFKFTEPNLMD